MIGFLLLGVAFFAGTKHENIKRFIGRIWRDLEE